MSQLTSNTKGHNNDHFYPSPKKEDPKAKKHNKMAAYDLKIKMDKSKNDLNSSNSSIGNKSKSPYRNKNPNNNLNNSNDEQHNFPNPPEFKQTKQSINNGGNTFSQSQSSLSKFSGTPQKIQKVVQDDIQNRSFPRDYTQNYCQETNLVLAHATHS